MTAPLPLESAALPEVAALLDRAGPQVGRVAVLGAGALGLALAAHLRWGAEIDLIDIDREGELAPTPEGRAAIAALRAAGVAPDRLSHMATGSALRPADLVVNLGLFGDGAKIAHLAPVLPRLMRPGARMLIDIRKGSGAFPFLRPFGTCSELGPAAPQRPDKPVTRTLFTAGPALEAKPASAAAPTEEDWMTMARRLAGPDGFVHDGGEHAFLYVPRGRTLVVTFDNLDIAAEKREGRLPWGFSFIEKQGWSMLGVMARGWTWYRDPWVWSEFDRLRDTGFFAGFDRVVFYGASMGGYAACAFLPACPGADAVVISPQSTLDRATVPWETRYRTAWGRDFAGPYGDAAKVSRAGGRVVLLFDPYEALDAAHAARFDGPNVMKLRAPLMGHRLGSSLQQMGILAPVTLAALDGRLTEGDFYRLLRARKTFPRYQKELFRRAVAKGHVTLARRLARWVLERGDNRAIRKDLASL